MDAHPRAVATLDVAAIVVSVIAAPAPFAFAGNGSSGPRPDDGTDRCTAASAKGSAEDRPSGSTQDGAAKGILGRRLMRRHRTSKGQQRRNSQISNHATILPIVVPASRKRKLLN
jgi:hypothetical protein